MAVQQDDDIFTQTLDDSDDEVGRGELIHAYQALIDRTAEEENVSSSLLTETIGMAENLFEAVTRTHEAAVDSTLMRAVTSHGRKLAAAALPEQTLDTEEFADRVRSVVSSSLHASTLDIKAWAKLADFAAGALKTSAPFWYLYGSAGEAPIKVRRARTTVREVAPDRPPTLPKELTSVKETAEETTTSRVDEIYCILQRFHKRLGKPVPFFEIVLHPRSFSKTCENIFHVSFLLSRGQARASYDESGQMMVMPVPKDTPHRPAYGQGIKFTWKEWQGLVQKLRITHPVIPE